MLETINANQGFKMNDKKNKILIFNRLQKINSTVGAKSL